MDPFIWFCCLPPYELSVTRGLVAAFAVVLGAPIPAAIYDALWLAPVPSHDHRKELYYWYFALGREWVIDPVTEEPIEVVFIQEPFWWLDLMTYVASPEGECSDGCKRRVFD